MSNNPAIKIGSNNYQLTDLYGKTLYAAQPLTIFNTISGRVASHTVKAGEPVGIVRGFVSKGHKTSSGIIVPRDFLLIGPNNASVKAAPYAANLYSESAVKSQGVKSTIDKASEDQAENEPWYTKLVKTLGPWVLVSVAAVTFIKAKVK
jgi:hypothetical protein